MPPAERRTIAAGAIVLILAFGIVLNPFLSTVESQYDALLALETIAFWGAIAWTYARPPRIPSPLEGEDGISEGGMFKPPRLEHVRAESSSSSEPTSSTNAAFVEHATPQASLQAWLILLLIFVAWLVLARFAWQKPRFITDDLFILRAAATWNDTQAFLFRPFNEHLLVPTRLWAYAAVQTSTPETLPYVLLATLAGLWAVQLALVFLLARREFRSDAWGLATAACFTLTYVHHEVWWWFMAGQWMWPTIFLSIALLVLDPQKVTAARVWWVAALAFVAMFAYSIGVLVGVVPALWIWMRAPERRRLAWIPLVGTAVGCAIAFPLIKEGLKLDNPNQYGVPVKWFAFDAWTALASANRLLVDHLVLHNLGWPVGETPAWAAALLFPAVGYVVWRGVRARPAFVAPYLAILGITYAIVVPFRSWNDFPGMTRWAARYQLLPHLGLVFMLIGAYASQSGGFRPLTRTSVRWLLLLIVVLLVLQESTHGAGRWRAP